MAKGEIKALTGLRAVAACMVTAYHFYPVSPQNGVLGHSLGRGYLWVDMFFVLSGFVLALNYGKWFEAGYSRRTFAEFLRRRVARIYPLYLAVGAVQLAFTLAVYGNFSHHGDWAAAVLRHPAPGVGANLLMVQAWGISDSIVGQAWSISTEWAAYIVFPLLASAAIYRGKRNAIWCGAAALLLLIVVVALDSHDGAYHSGAMDAYNGAHITPLLRCFGDFTLGLLVARLLAVPAATRLAARNAVTLGVIGTVGVLFLSGAPDLLICLSFPALVLCLATNQRIAEPFFANPLAHQLGVLSYSVYLLHGFVELPAQRLVPLIGGWPAAAFSWGGLILLAACTYRFIEVPGRRAISRISLPRSLPAYGA
jgi:peptidoglycan/LPS O-acetylase OafA/YrhL